MKSVSTNFIIFPPLTSTIISSLTLTLKAMTQLKLGVMTLTFFLSMTSPSVAVTKIKLGVMLNGDANLPYSVQRAGPAVDIAVETVNSLFLNDSYEMVTILKIYDDICDARYASGVASELYHKDGVHVLVGPACASALDHVARLAAYWNIPIITGLGDGGIFKNKTTYPTLTRFSYCQCRLRKVFASVFKEFGWEKDMSIIYDENDNHAELLGRTLKEGLQKNEYYPIVKPFYSNSHPNLTNILQEISEQSRIILLIVSGDLLRQFMLDAYDLGYPQSGEYVFMNVELFPFPGDYWGNNDWRRGDSRDPEAREAFESLLRISLHLPLSTEWDNFTLRCEEMSEKEYNFDYGSEEVNFFVGAFHDAVLRYGRAVNETIIEGANLTDGYAMTRRMWNYTTEDITGDVIIDDNGDRDTNFAIKDMDPDTGDFEIVAYYWGAKPGYTPNANRSIHWAGGRTEPPPYRPECGFKYDDPKCEVVEPLPTYMIVITSVFGIMVVGLVAGLFVYRRVMWEKDLNSTAWKVNFDDIKFRNQQGQSTKLSAYSLRTKESDSMSMHSKMQSFTLVGSYKGFLVAAKQVPVYKIDINRNVLLELKAVRGMHHENITKFVGACVELGNVHLLYEYCKKGSLQDVLLTDTLKLDWQFKISLLKDIVKGMVYIHQSEIEYHGHLTSANCVVDGKFNVKITDFGLPTFRQVQEWTQKTSLDDKHSELQKLLWVAPEHISGFKSTGGSKKGDIYSFAIIMEETLSRSVPYDAQRGLLEVEDIISRVCANENPPFRPEVIAHDVKESYVSLMEKCWEQAPEDRPSFDAILKTIHQFSGGKEVALVDRLLSRLEEYTSNLEDLVEERTQQLAQEKRKSERLLDEILPSSVSEKLKQGQPVDPESYDMVTIYFSDIVGFTSLSAMSTPLEVVELLNALYSRFDAAIENYDVYKVETIGDAYMVVSGLPLRNGNDHVLHVSRLALELLQLMTGFVVPHKPGHKLQLRIGLHSGPVVAGVVGHKMPRYCLFGDTVNTASRMESNGEALKIHISSSTKEILDLVGNFETECRGHVEMKGKGVQTTYWLLREIKEPKTSASLYQIPSNASVDMMPFSSKANLLDSPISTHPPSEHQFFSTHDSQGLRNNHQPIEEAPEINSQSPQINDINRTNMETVSVTSSTYLQNGTLKNSGSPINMMHEKNTSFSTKHPLIRRKSKVSCQPPSETSDTLVSLSDPVHIYHQAIKDKTSKPAEQNGLPQLRNGTVKPSVEPTVEVLHNDCNGLKSKYSTDINNLQTKLIQKEEEVQLYAHNNFGFDASTA